MSSTPVPVVESPEVESAYTVLADFFSTYSLSYARKYLAAILTTATGYKAWRANPSNVLFFFENLEGLLQAAITIHQSGFQRQAAIVSLGADGAPDTKQYRQYSGWHHLHASWHFFPRLLNKKEYSNPYKAFRRVAGLGGTKWWKNTCRELLHYALSTSRVTECAEAYNPLKLYFVLGKLLEACHLIEVRAITEIDGVLRPKWKEEAAATVVEETGISNPINEGL